jgi:pimeloyl-ACP methyl ester carboxylesterase
LGVGQGKNQPPRRNGRRDAGRLRTYRAFDRDAEDNRAALAKRGKLTSPVLAVGGPASMTGPLMGEMMRDVATNATELRVPKTGPRITEEDPEALLDGLRAFLETR